MRIESNPGLTAITKLHTYQPYTDAVIVQSHDRTTYSGYLGQSNAQQALEGPEVELRPTVAGVHLGLPTEPIDGDQNLREGEGGKGVRMSCKHMHTFM